MKKAWQPHDSWFPELLSAKPLQPALEFISRTWRWADAMVTFVPRWTCGKVQVPDLEVVTEDPPPVLRPSNLLRS